MYLTWKPYGMNKRELYAKKNLTDKWKPYKQVVPPALCKPDNSISKGFTTAGFLLTKGWKYLDK